MPNIIIIRIPSFVCNAQNYFWTYLERTTLQNLAIGNDQTAW